MPAAEIGDLRATLQLRDDTVQRRQPARDEIGVVARAEEPLAAVEHIVAVLVPPDAGTALRRLDDPRRVEHRPDRDLKEPGEKCRARGIGQGDRLFRGQPIAAAVGLVLDKAARSLSVAPLTDITLRQTGPVGQLAGGEWPGSRHRPVETELVTHHDERRVERGADLFDGTEHKRVQTLLVQRPLGFDR